MKKQIGLWLDHRKAVIVVLSGAGQETIKINSDMEKHVRFTGGTASEDGSTEDVLDRQFDNHLNLYYDKVYAIIHEADSLLILGPGQAKTELKKRLEHHHLKGVVLEVETADKLTDRQIAAKVRDHFKK
jgi:hypothetical protein